jgi:hypothetical protein
MVSTVILAIFFLWLIIVSWQLYRTKRHYSLLVKRTQKKQLDEILEKILQDNEQAVGEIKQIVHDLRAVSGKLKLSIQKIGLLRFNPFEREGLGQSFVLALMDDTKSGVVINFIQTRDGLRVYPKKVKAGKGIEYDLTDEEKKAIEKSMAVAY